MASFLLLPHSYLPFPYFLPFLLLLSHLPDAVYREDALCLAAILCREHGLDWALEVEVQGKRSVHTLLYYVT